MALLGFEPALHDTAAQRLQGYRSALEGVGPAQDDALLLRVRDRTREDGAAAGRALAADLRAGRADVDGVLAMNDVLALGLLQGLRGAGVRVPAEVAVVGVDDVAESACSAPSLTTVAIDRGAVARDALELLVTRLADPELPPRALVAPHRLVVRESSGG